MPLNRGALLVLADRVHEERTRRQKRADDLEDDRREFEQRLRIAGITAAVNAGQLEPSFGAQGQWQGFQTPEQRLLQQLPQSPFVVGPGGEGFLTGSSVEDPGVLPANQPINRNAVNRWLPNIRGSVSNPSSGFSRIPASLPSPQGTVEETPRITRDYAARTMANELQQARLQQRNLVPVYERTPSGLHSVGQVPKGAKVYSPRTTQVNEFRQDLQDAIEAVSTGAIDKRAAIKRLLDKYPDKANTILSLEQTIF